MVAGTSRPPATPPRLTDSAAWCNGYGPSHPARPEPTITRLAQANIIAIIGRSTRADSGCSTPGPAGRGAGGHVASGQGQLQPEVAEGRGRRLPTIRRPARVAE